VIVVLLNKNGTQLTNSSLADLLVDDVAGSVAFGGRLYKFTREVEPGVFHYQEAV